LPARATSLTLQKKLAAAAESAYTDVATGQAGGATVAVTGLYGSTDYEFRCIAVGPTGSTPGEAGQVTTDEAAPYAPAAPTFSDLTLESVVVHAPQLPPSTTDMVLQGK